MSNCSCCVLARCRRQVVKEIFNIVRVFVQVAIHKGRDLSSVHTFVSGVLHRTWVPFVFTVNSVKCTSLNDS